MEEQITARIAELEAERERLVVEANRQVYAYNVAINELRRLLPQPEPPLANSGDEVADGAGRDDEADAVHQDDVAGLG